MKTFFKCMIITLVLVQSTFGSMRCLNELKKNLVHKSIPKTNIKDRYSKYRKFLRSDIFAKRKKEILNKIEYWSRMSERDIRLKHLRKAQIRSFILEALHLDHHDALAFQLSPLFYRVQHSYYSLKRFTRMEAGLVKVLKKIKQKNYSAATKAIKRLIKKENYHLDIINLEKTLSDKSISFVEAEIMFMENRQLDQLISITKNFDQYAEAKKLLENPPEAGMEEKVGQALEQLEGKKAQENFLYFVDKAEKLEAPSVAELEKLINKNPIVQIMHLEKELKQERWTSIASRLSPYQLHELFDAIARKVPMLNKPSIRSYVRFAIDNKDILTYYPNIDRLVSQGTNNPKQMWEYLMGQDAKDRGMDNFLMTFARRVDVRTTWRQLVQHSKKRVKELNEEGIKQDLEINMYNRIERVQLKVKDLPNLPPWHHPPEGKLVGFLIDGIMLIGLAYGGNYIFTKFWPEDEKDKGKVKPKSIDQEKELKITPIDNKVVTEKTSNKPFVVKDKKGDPLIEFNVILKDVVDQ